MSFSNSKPLPAPFGSMRSLTWPYCPLPPVCRMYLPSGFGLLADGLAISDLRFADVGLDVELAHHAVDDDFQVQLAHAADDRLPAVLVGRDPEGRIFLRQLAERNPHLFLIALGLGLDGNRDHRVGELDRLQHDRVLFVGDGVAGGHVLQADAGADVSGENFRNLLALVGVHAQQAADALTALLTRVINAVAALQLRPNRRG